MFHPQVLGLLSKGLGAVNLFEEVESFPMSFQHVQDAIFCVLVVVPACYGILKVLTQVVEDVSSHWVASVPTLVDFDKVLGELDTLILECRAHLLLGFSLVLLLLLMKLLLFRNYRLLSVVLPIIIILLHVN